MSADEIYLPFDRWLNVPTWHTSHPLDAARFHRALAEACDDPRFSAEGLGRYIMGKAWGESLSFPIDKQARCDHFVAIADTVAEHYAALRRS